MQSYRQQAALPLARRQNRITRPKEAVIAREESECRPVVSIQKRRHQARRQRVNLVDSTGDDVTASSWSATDLVCAPAAWIAQSERQTFLSIIAASSSAASKTFAVPKRPDALVVCGLDSSDSFSCLSCRREHHRHLALITESGEQPLVSTTAPWKPPTIAYSPSE